jgi:hypothetical protein
MRSTRSSRRTSTNSVVSEEAISSVSVCRCSGREENARSDARGIPASDGRAVLDGGIRGKGHTVLCTRRFLYRRKDSF